MPGLNYNDQKQFKLTDEALKNIKEASGDNAKLEQELNQSMFRDDKSTGGVMLRISELTDNMNPSRVPFNMNTSISDFGDRRGQSEIGSTSELNPFKSRQMASELDISEISNTSFLQDKHGNGMRSSNLMALKKKMHDSSVCSNSGMNTPRRNDLGLSRSSIPRMSHMLSKRSHYSSNGHNSDRRHRNGADSSRYGESV